MIPLLQQSIIVVLPSVPLAEWVSLQNSLVFTKNEVLLNNLGIEKVLGCLRNYLLRWTLQVGLVENRILLSLPQICLFHLNFIFLQCSWLLSTKGTRLLISHRVTILVLINYLVGLGRGLLVLLAEISFIFFEIFLVCWRLVPLLLWKMIKATIPFFLRISSEVLKMLLLDWLSVLGTHFLLVFLLIPVILHQRFDIILGRGVGSQFVGDSKIRFRTPLPASRPSILSIILWLVLLSSWCPIIGLAVLRPIYLTCCQSHFTFLPKSFEVVHLWAGNLLVHLLMLRDEVLLLTIHLLVAHLAIHFSNPFHLSRLLISLGLLRGYHVLNWILLYRAWETAKPPTWFLGLRLLLNWLHSTIWVTWIVSSRFHKTNKYLLK